MHEIIESVVFLEVFLKSVATIIDRMTNLKAVRDLFRATYWMLAVVLVAVATAGCKSSQSSGTSPAHPELFPQDKVSDAIIRVKDSFDFTDYAKRIMAADHQSGRWRADKDCGDYNRSYFDCVRVIFDLPNAQVNVIWYVLYNANTGEFSQFSEADQSRGELHLIFKINDRYRTNSWNEHGNPFNDGN